MNSRQKKLLKECLLDKKIPFNQKIGEFIKILNAGVPAPSPSSEKWIISNDEWQRYEFLGDRVLNLVAAGYLYNLAPAEREGDLTKRMGVVSNESLAEIINRRDWDVSRLIPDSIGQQKTYGERVKGKKKYLSIIRKKIIWTLGCREKNKYIFSIYRGQFPKKTFHPFTKAT